MNICIKKTRIGWTLKESKLNTFQIFCAWIINQIQLCIVTYTHTHTHTLWHLYSLHAANLLFYKRRRYCVRYYATYSHRYSFKFCIHIMCISIHFIRTQSVRGRERESAVHFLQIVFSLLSLFISSLFEFCRLARRQRYIFTKCFNSQHLYNINTYVCSIACCFALTRIRFCVILFK